MANSRSRETARAPARLATFHARHQESVREQIYIPFEQLPDSFMRPSSGMSLLIRTTVPPLNVVFSGLTFP
jgi:hypothetical protein